MQIFIVEPGSKPNRRQLQVGGRLASIDAALCADLLLAITKDAHVHGLPANTPNFGTTGEDAHHLTHEQFMQRWSEFFNGARDVFELHRGLNNVFSYDMVPVPDVVTAALKAARRLNDYPTAVRIIQALREVCKDEKEYNEYLQFLKPLLAELSVEPAEQLGL